MDLADRSPVDEAFRELMKAKHRETALELGKSIFNKALDFWERSCRVEVNPQVRDEICHANEFKALLQPLRWTKCGRIEGGDWLPRGPLVAELRRRLNPQTKRKCSAWAEQVDVAKIAIENLYHLRNVEAHTSSSIDDPSTVATAAGALLMQIDHAPEEKGTGESVEQLRESARRALEFCVRQLDPDDEEEGAAEGGVMETSIRAEVPADGVAPPLTPAVDGQVVQALKSLDSRLLSVAEATAVMDARLERLASGRTEDENTGVDEEKENRGVASEVLQGALRELQTATEDLKTRGIAESDLRYLLSLVKKEQGMPRELDPVEKEVRKGVEEVLKAVETLQGSFVNESRVEEAAVRGARRAFSEDRGGRMDPDALRDAVIAAVQAAREQLPMDQDGSSNAVYRLTADVRKEVIATRSAVDGLAGKVDALREGSLESTAQGERSETQEPAEDYEPLEPDPPPPVDLLTTQQATNRLVSLRNVIKDQMDIEWFDCILQRKFIDQMIRERLRTREQWLEAQGVIRRWFEDVRNRDKRDLVNEQWSRYGERIAAIMDRIMDGDEE